MKIIFVKKKLKLVKKREIVKHTKFVDDNLQRKCITIIMNDILEFVNKKLYNGNMNCKKLPKS